MKTIHQNLAIYLSLLLISIQTVSLGQINYNTPQKWYYAVEINGVLCGYSESNMTVQKEMDNNYCVVKDHILVRLSVLGGSVDMTIDNTLVMQDETLTPVSNEHVVQTSAEMYGYSRFEKNKVYHTNSRESELKEIELPDYVIIENKLSYPHLMKDFILGNAMEKEYDVYDDFRGIIAKKIYKRIREERLVLADTVYETLLLEEFNQKLGTITKLWLRKENSFPVKVEVAGRTISLADESVKKKIKIVDLDNVLFARVDKLIPNVPDLIYMKVAAKIESGGEWLSLEGLNRPGQNFTGTVNNNLVEGIFELRSVRYNGENAPNLPYNIQDDSLQKYIEAESLIESDNPLLIREAKNITAGAISAWEAAVRLSTWVSKNIRGAVPGGTSAINTYQTREGECGSHSRLLVAFCRAVGIPARLVAGCMYSPYLGGSFGQHAWTEVYMGVDGWVPIDATAFEYDYIDAGHIRLGENASFNPGEMKILEYKLQNDTITKKKIPEKFLEYIGKYKAEGNGESFEIKYQEGSLAVDIPGQMTLSLNDPDEKGVLYPKMTRQVYFSFIRDDHAVIRQLKLQQVMNLERVEGPDNIPEDLPEELVPYLGKYKMSMNPALFEVLFINGNLAVNDPLNGRIIGLKNTEIEGNWIDEFDKNEIGFEQGEDGAIRGMIIYVNLYMPKIAGSDAD